ncbi:alpha/beta fold hydrolase [Glutamicibacter endophyticus]|uniref:alpha/beta fold hydrolase n=1 Tax=Glutamicibacter endophyticus TaxID=1522174 RepID=UPI003AEFD421
MQRTQQGLTPHFDADIMQETIAAVHQPRWTEWETLEVQTLAVFARDGMFDAASRAELVRRRPATQRIDLRGGTHDAHLDAFDEWIQLLRIWLR